MFLIIPYSFYLSLGKTQSEQLDVFRSIFMDTQDGAYFLKELCSP